MTAAAPPGLYVLGFGGHARAVADIAVSAGVRRLVFVDANARLGEAFAGHPAVQGFPQNASPGWQVFPAMGDNRQRRALCDAQYGPLATLVAPSATIGIGAMIGAGTLIAHHAHVGPAARIGRGVIINTGAIVEHDAHVGDYSHVSIRASIAGRCRIGANVLIGAGATVIDGITIVDDVTIGAGATVVRDIVQPGTYVGTPARVLPRR